MAAAKSAVATQDTEWMNRSAVSASAVTHSYSRVFTM
jgi:hypothetical protein